MRPIRPAAPTRGRRRRPSPGPFAPGPSRHGAPLGPRRPRARGRRAVAAALALALAPLLPQAAAGASLKEVEPLFRARLAEFARPQAPVWEDYAHLAALARLAPVFAPVSEAPGPLATAAGGDLLDAPAGRFAPRAVPAELLGRAEGPRSAAPGRAPSPRPRPAANAATAMALLAARLDEGVHLDALLLERLRARD